MTEKEIINIKSSYYMTNIPPYPQLYSIANQLSKLFYGKNFHKYFASFQNILQPDLHKYIIYVYIPFVNSNHINIICIQNHILNMINHAKRKNVDIKTIYQK